METQMREEKGEMIWHRFIGWFLLLLLLWRE